MFPFNISCINLIIHIILCKIINYIRNTALFHLIFMGYQVSLPGIESGLHHFIVVTMDKFQKLNGKTAIIIITTSRAGWGFNFRKKSI